MITVKAITFAAACIPSKDPIPQQYAIKRKVNGTHIEIEIGKTGHRSPVPFQDGVRKLIVLYLGEACSHASKPANKGTTATGRSTTVPKVQVKPYMEVMSITIAMQSHKYCSL
mmetsp:Transcript_3614/g.22640  ORF Transcript_3614/g.22640 Transcript_3614/m.22640 type:complete len:113 (-) Transcript_3614:895-1233(-)